MNINFIKWQIFGGLFVLYCLSNMPVFAEPYSAPLQKEQWQILSYDRIKSHKVSFDHDRLHIDIRKSAGPVIHVLPNPIIAKSILVRAKVIGDLELKDGIQGNRGNDDFRLRVGIIYSGNRVLDEFQLGLAPQWIQRLYKSLPENTGVGEVMFYNTWIDPRLQDSIRNHPSSVLLRERFSIRVEKNGRIDQQIMLDRNDPVIGIWIGSDGDDTGSCFKVEISTLQLD